MRVSERDATILMLQVIVLLCGTNNHDHTAEQVSEGILEIVRTIKEKQPQAQVIVLVSDTYSLLTSHTQN